MKSIAKVELRNYRSHEHSVVEFDKLTSIIGDNDQGKSNVYRGMEMVLLHQPFTEAHLRYGTKEGSVTLYFDDDTWIERTRKGTKQTCRIFDGKSTRAFDTIKDIAEIVQEFTGFRPITIDKNSKPESVQLIPIDAGQTFMITGLSPDGVLRRINRLMAGSGVETARIALEKDARAIERELSTNRGALERQQTVVDALEHEDWTAAESLYGVLDTWARNADELIEVIDALEQCHKALNVADDLKALAEVAKDAVAKARDLTVVIERVMEQDKKHAVLSNAMATIVPTLDDLTAMYSDEDALTLEIEESRKTLDAAIVADHERKKEAEMKEARICPTCKRPL